VADEVRDKAVSSMVGERGSKDWHADGLTITWLGDSVRMTVVGEVDVSTRDQFRAALDDLLGALGDVGLDLQGVSFMDTRGVTLVVHTAKRLHEEGGRLIVHDPPDSLVRIFETLWGSDGEWLHISGRRGDPR
jgi:anti-anti-sigma factor